MVLRIRHHNHRITAQLNRTSGLFRGSIPLRLPVVSSNTWEERGSADLHDSPVADASTGRPPSFQWSDCGSPNLASVPEPNTAALLLAGAGSSASDFAGARLAFLTRSFHRIWGKGEVSVGFHSEGLIAQKLLDLQRAGKKIRVRQIYTERWPCKSTCAPLLDRNYSETPVFHSLRRGDESRAEKLMEAYGIVVR